MRREQVHKVCANHNLVSGMTIKFKEGNEKALLWKAKDFSEEELRDETFVARFKTPDEAKQFKEAFKQAIKLAGSYIF